MQKDPKNCLNKPYFGSFTFINCQSWEYSRILAKRWYNSSTMKSQYIKIRNVPEEIRKKSVAVHVKPWALLDLCPAL